MCRLTLSIAFNDSNLTRFRIILLYTLIDLLNIKFMCVILTDYKYMSEINNKCYYNNQFLEFSVV